MRFIYLNIFTLLSLLNIKAFSVDSEHIKNLEKLFGMKVVISKTDDNWDKEPNENELLTKKFKGYSGKLSYNFTEDRLKIYETPKNTFIKSPSSKLIISKINIEKQSAHEYTLHFIDGETFNLSELFVD